MLFGYDEVNQGVVYTTTREWMDEINAEIGVEHKETLENGVRVGWSDRYYFLEVEANTGEEAHEKFMAFPPYKKDHEDMLQAFPKYQIQIEGVTK